MSVFLFLAQVHPEGENDDSMRSRCPGGVQHENANRVRSGLQRGMLHPGQESLHDHPSSGVLGKASSRVPRCSQD